MFYNKSKEGMEKIMKKNFKKVAYVFFTLMIAIFVGIVAFFVGKSSKHYSFAVYKYKDTIFTYQVEGKKIVGGTVSGNDEIQINIDPYKAHNNSDIIQQIKDQITELGGYIIAEVHV